MVSGLVFGISNTAVTPPITALREPLSRSSLWVEAGLAEMHLGVDHAGQDVQARGNRSVSAGRRLRQVAERRDPAAGDADIARALAVVIDDGAALEDQVEALGHSNVTLL